MREKMEGVLMTIGIPDCGRETRVNSLKINAETSDLHPIVMCTSKSENVHPFFSIRHRSHQDISLVTKLQGENTGVLS